MNVFTRMRLIALAAILLAPLSACALSGEAIEGNILEEGTNKPLANVIVVALWSGDLWAIVESQTVCVHVESAVTDAQGSFRLPAWRKDSKIGWVRNLEPTLSAHYPGYNPLRITPLPTSERLVRYGQFPLEHGLFGIKPTTLYMAPFTGTRGERLEYLSRVSGSTGCGTQDESQKNLIPLRMALYEEAKNIAATKGEKQIVNNLLQSVEWLELGSDKSWENWEKRKRELQ